MFILHCWIYEHFQPIYDKHGRGHIIDGSPHATRWRSKNSYLRGLLEYMRRINAMIIDDVIWTPYANHGMQWEFDDTTLFFWLSMIRELCG